MNSVLPRVLASVHPCAVARDRLLQAMLATAAWASLGFAATPDAIVPQQLGIDRPSVQRLSASTVSGVTTFTLELDGRPVTLRLERFSVRAEGFRVLVQDVRGMLREIPPPEPETYRGTVAELPGSLVGGALHEGSLAATIALTDGSVFFVQPMAELQAGADRALHVVYRADDEIAEGACPVHEAPQLIAPSPVGSSARAGTPLEYADLAVDADFEYLGKNGGSAASTVNDIQALLNSVNVVYERDCNLRHRLVTLIVRESNPDPYVSTDAIALYNELRNHWNSAQTAVARDIVHLMTGKELDGGTIGYAAVGAVCNRSRAYGLSQARFTTNLARRTALVAHELGHNWNAVHCDGVTPCHIMCSSIGSCSGIGQPQFEPMGAEAIRDFAASRTCLYTPVAVEPGRAPDGVELAVPDPSPFMQQTRLRFFQLRAGVVRLGIYDIAGHRIVSLAEGRLDAGWHSRAWTGVDERGVRLGPGMYYGRLETPHGTRTQKVILLR